MKKRINSARTPIYRDTGFELSDAYLTYETFEKEKEHERDPENFIYSRYRNPTVVAAEDEIMRLEGSKWALLTQSGMSAIDVALSIFQRGKETRPWLFLSEIYGGTISFIDSVLVQRRGLVIEWFLPENDSYDLSKLEDLIKRLRPEVIYMEVISNPMLIVAPPDKIIDLAGKYKCKVLVDNTFATPLLCKPLDMGADMVIHSGTKYFGGHGNITAGAVCGNDPDRMKEAIAYRKFVGHMLSADDAYRLHTQIQSFELRFTQQCRNAVLIADILNSSSLVNKVWFPGLDSHKTHVEARSLFGNNGYGAMITFDFAGTSNDEKRRLRDSFIGAVSEKIKLIPTLGDSHTILLPVESVWGHKYKEPGMIRLSIGFENSDELIASVNAGLEKTVKAH